MADEGRETLRRLEAQLDRATEAAERLASEAAEARSERPRQKPPPAGWQAPPASSPGDSGASPGAELDALLNAIRSMRELIPPEVLHRLADALREVLLAIRALIDFYIERLERRQPEPPEVEDIPIR